jgi:hypothetical protein
MVGNEIDEGLQWRPWTIADKLQTAWNRTYVEGPTGGSVSHEPQKISEVFEIEPDGESSRFERRIALGRLEAWPAMCRRPVSMSTSARTPFPS